MKVAMRLCNTSHDHYVTHIMNSQCVFSAQRNHEFTNDNIMLHSGRSQGCADGGVGVPTILPTLQESRSKVSYAAIEMVTACPLTYFIVTVQ